MSRSRRENDLLSSVRPEHAPYFRIPRQDVDAFTGWAVDALEYLSLPRDAKIVMDRLTTMSRGLPDAIIDVSPAVLVAFIGWAEAAQQGCPATDEQKVLIETCKAYRDTVEQQSRRVKSAVRDYWTK